MRGREFRRQLHVDDADAAEALDREDAADGDGRQRREIRADRLERKFDVGLAAAIEPVARPRPRFGKDGVRVGSSVRSATTRAPTRAFSSGVSPGVGTKVPVDWSLAILRRAPRRRRASRCDRSCE